ncbi:hypothetical protein O3794_02845 [Gemella sanguinis]|uniref:hypothetical protein n=1 Tax=Gemella sanguinis TaxID=84135 RepID=UPI00352F4AD3
MNLKIGKHNYNIKLLTADFPIKFYKETGIDIFTIEDKDKPFIELYEICLNLAYALVKYEGTLEDFASEFTPADLMGSYEDIFECYLRTTESKIESKTEKK